MPTLADRTRRTKPPGRNPGLVVDPSEGAERRGPVRVDGERSQPRRPRLEAVFVKGRIDRECCVVADDGDLGRGCGCCPGPGSRPSPGSVRRVLWRLVWFLWHVRFLRLLLR